MPKECAICGKGAVAGRSIKRRGKAKKDGGVGRNITGISKRSFKPNLQKIKVEHNGGVKRLHVCTKCIKSGKVKKAA